MTPRFDGYDISHWNGHVDWSKVPHTKFMAFRATKGATEVDVQWANNHAHSDGKADYRFFYHFVTQDDPKVQAAHFKKVVGDLKPGDGVMVDVERWGTQVPILSFTHVNALTAEVANQFGIKPIIYIGAYYPHANVILNDHAWFLPAWDRPQSTLAPFEKRVGHKAVVWQYASGHGHHVPGIGGGVKAVDSDMILDEATLSSFVVKK